MFKLLKIFGMKEGEHITIPSKQKATQCIQEPVLEILRLIESDVSNRFKFKRSWDVYDHPVRVEGVHSIEITDNTSGYFFTLFVNNRGTTDHHLSYYYSKYRIFNEDESELLFKAADKSVEDALNKLKQKCEADKLERLKEEADKALILRQELKEYYCTLNNIK